MNHAPIHRHASARLRTRKSYASGVAALAAAMLSLSPTSLFSASGTWQANPGDQGVSLDVLSDGSSWTLTKGLIEGDAIFIPITSGGVNLGTGFSYYFAVGAGSTPTTQPRFSTSPSAGTFNPNGAAPNPMTVTKIPSWFNAGNWTGGVVPNGIDDVATIASPASMNALLLDRNVTLGGITIDTTNCGAHAFDSLGSPLAGTNGVSIMATSRMAGPLSTLTFERSSGTPSITLSGGNSLVFSDSKLSSSGGGGNTNAKLVVVGDQGLSIENQNPIAAPVALNSRTIETVPLNVATFGSGQVRFGFGLDWSLFSGDLTLSKGVFQTLAGGSLNNNLSSLPMNSKVVLGTGTNTARLEMTGSIGQTVIRGLESSPTANSSVINTSTVVNTGSIGLATLQIGSYGKATDSYTYAGNIGDSTDIATVASVSSIRLVKAGPGTQILSGVNNLNATQTNAVQVAVNGGKLSLGTTGAMGTITGGQGATNADSSIILKNGEFEISGLGTGAARSQGFGGYLIFGTAQPQTGSPDTNQASQSTSYSTLTVIADPAHPTTMNFGQLKPRNYGGGPTSNTNGVTMLFRGTNLGAAPGAGVATVKFTTPPTTGGGILNGSGSLGTVEAPVLKGALADPSPTGNGAGFATYDEVKGVRLLDVSEQNTVGAGAAYNTASTSQNLLITLNADGAITGHASNTLQVVNSSGSVKTLTNSGTELNPRNGLLFSGSAPIVLTGGQITGTVDMNADDVLIHSINSSEEGVTIQSAVSNGSDVGNRQGWITYSGSGNFRIEGKQTVGVNGPTVTFGGMAFNSTGTTTLAGEIFNAFSLNVNKGIVKMDTGVTWTNTPRLLLSPEAKFDLNGISGTATTNRFSDINSGVIAAGLSLNPISGEVTNSSVTTADLILFGAVNGVGGTNQAFFGTITGNLNLILEKSSFNAGASTYSYAVQAFSNENTYTGSTQIRSGILNLARGGLLPKSTVVTLGPAVEVPDATSYPNSTLRLGDANGSTNGAVRQEIAGLYATGIGRGLGAVETGNGTSEVINASSVVSQLTLNIPEGVDNVYTGNLGITPGTNGSNQNLLGLRKIGAGIFEPAGLITSYSGGTIIEGGIFRVSSDSKLGQIGSLTGAAGSSGAPTAPISAFQNSIILNGGTLQTTTTADFVLDAKRGIGLGPVDGVTGGTGTLWVDSGVTLTYDGVIASAGNTGTQSLVKNGSGALVLNGPSTFTGVTNVTAGSLAGIGSLASGVTVNSGGALAPGNGGVGTFTIGGDLTLNAGAVLNLELAAPGTSDLLQVSGGVSATGSATINLVDLSGFGVGTYTLISGSAPISTTNLRVGSVPSGFNGTLSSVGNNLVVTIAVGSPLSALESWRAEKFGDSDNEGNAADTADYDKDGIPNLIEYATGTDPLVYNTGAFSSSRSGNFLTLTYTRIADSTLTYTVEGSNDLGVWTTVATESNPSTGVSNVAGQVVVTDTVSTATVPRRFLRLKVSY